LLTSDDNFPTDLYALQSVAAQNSLELRVLPADPIEGLGIEVLRGALSSDVALLALSHIAYRSGALLDMTEVTRMAHDCGALVLWDVSHSAGSVRVPLESSNADLAVGCTYKYLNGGPGAPSFVYVRTSQQQLRQPLWGWFGHREQFTMSSSFEPAEGIESFLVGIPAILSTVAIEPGVRCIAEAGIERLQVKGRQLTELIIALADEWLAPHGFSVASPRDARRRGSHVTLRHPRAREFVRALIAQDVTPDFRPPDMIRLGPAPLYTRFVDVWDAMDRLRRLCEAQGRAA
jgi:kynureninase